MVLFRLYPCIEIFCRNRIFLLVWGNFCWLFCDISFEKKFKIILKLLNKDIRDINRQGLGIH